MLPDNHHYCGCLPRATRSPNKRGGPAWVDRLHFRRLGQLLRLIGPDDMDYSVRPLLSGVVNYFSRSSQARGIYHRTASQSKRYRPGHPLLHQLGYNAMLAHCPCRCGLEVLCMAIPWSLDGLGPPASY